VSQPFETLETQCMNCGRKLRVPAARRRRAWRLGHATADFCGKACSVTYISRTGRKAQAALLMPKKQP
jgi:hypothetical protein